MGLALGVAVAFYNSVTKKSKLKVGYFYVLLIYMYPLAGDAYLSQ